MAVGIKALSTTAATNASADSNINFAEGQLAPTLNNSSRALMALLAGFYDQIGGGATYGGSSNAYTITMPTVGTWAAYASGDLVMLRANHTNTGAATVNIDSVGATAIKKNTDEALIAGDIQSGGFYLMSYDGTNFQIVNTIGASGYQPLDATLTAIAALSIAAGKVIVGTGTDTFSLYDVLGSDTGIATGTAGTSGYCAQWNGDGDLVDGKALPSGTIVGTTDSQTLTNKVLTSPTVNGGTASTRMIAGNETSGTLTAASANDHILATGGITLPASVFSARDAITIDGNGTNRTITRGSGLTMYWNGSDTASVTLDANGVCGVVYRSATVCIINGNLS